MHQLWANVSHLHNASVDYECFLTTNTSGNRVHWVINKRGPCFACLLNSTMINPHETCYTISFFLSLFLKSNLTEFPKLVRNLSFLFILLCIFLRVYVQYKVAWNRAALSQFQNFAKWKCYAYKHYEHYFAASIYLASMCRQVMQFLFSGKKSNFV